MKQFDTDEIKTERDDEGSQTAALQGQLSWNLHPGRRVVQWLGLGLLFLVILFLLIKMIQAPADGVSLHTTAVTDVPADPASVPETAETILPESSPESDSPSGEEETDRTGGAWFSAFLENLSNSFEELTKIPPRESREPEQSVSILALGDNLMHNTVMWAGQTSYGYNYDALYYYIKDDVQAADIACINQETIFINDPKQFTNYPSFGGPVQIGEALIRAGFDVIEHATNHCYDKFAAGIKDTLEFWHKHPEITVLGIHDSQEDADTIRVIEKNGIRISFLNYTYGTNAGYPEKPYMIDYLSSREKIAEDIEKAKELSDFVIVFPHWGSENTFAPNDSQREWAQFFADHGVGAVIGCHTHTLQPVELYTRPDGGEMPVYWSLGNFISHMSRAQNMLGGMAKLTVSRDRYGVFVSEFELVPTMTYGTHDSGKWEFYGMKLSDYNDYMAKHHLIDGTSVEEMNALYASIMKED